MESKKIEELNKLPELLEYLLNQKLGILNPKIYELNLKRQGDCIVLYFNKELVNTLFGCKVTEKITQIESNKKSNPDKNNLKSIFLKQDGKRFLIVYLGENGEKIEAYVTIIEVNGFVKFKTNQNIISIPRERVLKIKERCADGY